LQVLGACDVNGIDLLPGLIFQAAGHNRCILPSSTKKSVLTEQNNSHDAGLPFDLNDPQEEQENLDGGIICIISNTCYQ
jgi:hypothetical protein